MTKEKDWVDDCNEVVAHCDELMGGPVDKWGNVLIATFALLAFVVPFALAAA